MSHEPAIRVVCGGLPYLVTDHHSDEPGVFGPFEPGTEPSLDERSPDRLVTDRELRERILGLTWRSPSVPPHATSLAERE